MHNKGIIDKLDAWPTFLSMDSSEVIVMMEMYSEELKILDRNTVKYMVDQMQEQIDSQKELIDNQKEQLVEKEKEIQELKRKLAERK